MQVQTITPALAEEWLGRNHSNRNIRATLVAQLVRDMKAGAFVFTSESIKFDWNGNLIDGQHRLTAISESGVTVQSMVVRGLNPTVRATIDTGTKRSPSDALRMAGKGAGGRSMAAAIRLLIAIRNGQVTRAGDTPAAATHSEVLAFYDQGHETLDYCIAFANRTSRALNARPSALGAAAYIAAERGTLDEFTAFISRAVAMEFATGNDPARTLYKRLQTLRDESHMPSEELYYLLRAFNAALKGERLAGMKSSTGPGRSIIPTWNWGGVAA